MKTLKKIFLLTIIGLSSLLFPIYAQSTFKIQVTADHTDWIYKVREKVMYRVTVTLDGKSLENAKISYEIGPEKMKPTKKDSCVLTNGSIELEGGTMKVPGFLRCRVKSTYNGIKYEGLATTAFEPEKIKPTAIMPTDFVSFWEKAILEMSTIPLDSKMKLLPERCTEKVNVYEANFQNCAIGMRVYGILCIPKASGKYPVLLDLPGSSVRPYKGSIKLAEKGIITLQIGIHGIPVTLDSVVYANLKYGALKGYSNFNLDNRDKNYFKHVNLGCIRSIDFLCSLPEFDGSNVGVSGGSQGGALAIVTAALDSRIKCVSALFPNNCDFTAYEHGRAGANTFEVKGSATKKKLEETRYYDVVNFAKLIKAPGYYSFGFNDEVCPPTSVCSAFNSIIVPKTIFIAKETGHNNPVKEQFTKSDEFLIKMLIKN